MGNLGLPNPLVSELVHFLFSRPRSAYCLSELRFSGVYSEATRAFASRITLQHVTRHRNPQLSGCAQETIMNWLKLNLPLPCPGRPNSDGNDEAFCPYIKILVMPHSVYTVSAVCDRSPACPAVSGGCKGG